MDPLYSTKFKLQDNLFINEFEKLKSKIEKFPESAILLNRLANLASINGNLELEADYLNKASLLSNSEFFIHRIGDNLIGRGEITEARNIFGKLNIKSDHYANLRFASLLVGENRVDEASEYVERAVEIDPIEYSSRLFQGALRLLKGSAEKAISSFRIAIEDRPTSSVAYANLALAYAKLSLDKKAVGALRRAVSLNPLNSNALIMLADLSFKIGQNKDAVSALKYYVQYEQKSSPHWERLARALLAMGSTSEAIEALKRQASVERSSAVWNNLGVVNKDVASSHAACISASA
ncbi:putative Zn-dependent protease [Oxalobacteraceae bacterium GrIS 2.11]